MLLPKRVKHRKQHRGRMTGRAMRGNRIAHGDFGLVALEPAWITNRQIEAARIAMTRYIKRGGQVWIQIFPDKPITAKPAETRMGSGKGSPEKSANLVSNSAADNSRISVVFIKLHHPFLVRQLQLPVERELQICI